MRLTLFVALSPLLFTLSASVSAASVKSMSGEFTVQGPDGEEYLVSEVNCSGRKDDRAIWRKVSGGDWCGRDVEGYCSRRKISAAKLVCDRDYGNALEALTEAGTSKPPQGNSTPKADAEKLPETAKPPETEKPAAGVASPASAKQAGDELAREKEQLAIERERLKLEQDRLELRRQQMELQKQELEMKRQMQAQQEAEKTPPKPRAAAPQGAKEEPVEAAPASGVKKNVLGM